MVYSILLAQWHFFDEDLFKVLFRTIRGSELTVQEDVSKTTLLENIHQARSPTSWLRLQDHETALEVINIIKPAAHSYIAKVYEPVVFVLKGSNRTPSIKAPKFLPAVYDFAHHELAHLLLVLVFSLGVVRTIVGFALWKDEDDDLANEPESADGSLLSLSSYPGGHTLDIALLTTSCHGHVVTVGLDRSIRIWNVQVGGFSYSIPEEQIPVDSMFPILAMAIDDEEKCLALISPSVIRFWDMDNRNWCHSVAVNVGSQKPECVFFRSISLEEEELTLVVISCDGRAIEIQPASENSCTSLNICGGPLASAHTLIPKGTDGGSAHHVVLISSRSSEIAAVRCHPNTRLDAKFVALSAVLVGVQQIAALSHSPVFLMATPSRIFVFNVDLEEVQFSFAVENMRPRSLRCFHEPSIKPLRRFACVSQLAFAYEEASSGNLVVLRYSPSEDCSGIWIKTPQQSKGGFCSWKDCKVLKKRVENPGVWELLPNGQVAGIRKLKATGGTQIDIRKGLRHRKRRDLELYNDKIFEDWELWTTSTSSETSGRVQPLFQDSDTSGHLFVSNIGPRSPAGESSLAFAFGNVLKIVTLSTAGNPESENTEPPQDTFWKGGTRRGRLVASGRARAWS